jgi:hypothetical protein
MDTNPLYDCWWVYHNFISDLTGKYFEEFAEMSCEQIRLRGGITTDDEN